MFAPSGLQPVLDRRGRRIVNLTGDGALIELVSAVEALSATIEFQQAMETESQRPEAKRLVFCGLHLVNIRPGPTARTPVATQHQQMLDQALRSAKLPRR